MDNSKEVLHLTRRVIECESQIRLIKNRAKETTEDLATQDKLIKNSKERSAVAIDIAIKNQTKISKIERHLVKLAELDKKSAERLKELDLRHTELKPRKVFQKFFRRLNI